MPDEETIQRDERVSSRGAPAVTRSSKFLWAGSKPMSSGPLMKAIPTPGRLSPDSRQDAGTMVTQLRFPYSRIFSIAPRICAPGAGIHMDFFRLQRLPALNHFCDGGWGVSPD